MSDKHTQDKQNNNAMPKAAPQGVSHELSPTGFVIGEIGVGPNGAPAELPRNSNSRALRQTQLALLQRQHGNSFVQRFLARRAANSDASSTASGSGVVHDNGNQSSSRTANKGTQAPRGRNGVDSDLTGVGESLFPEWDRSGPATMAPLEPPPPPTDDQDKNKDRVKREPLLVEQVETQIGPQTPEEIHDRTETLADELEVDDIQRAPDGSALAVEKIQREDEEPLLNPQALTLEEELKGHALTKLQRRPDGSIQRQPGGGGTTANISLDVKPPTVNRLPEQTISSRHGSAGIAGWTKAKLRASPTPPTKDHIDIKLTLTFTMDLAEEYRGEVLAVLQDHENGHVKISTDLVNKLKDDLKWYLESLPDFTADNEVAAAGAVKRAVRNFVTDDEEAQKAFDASDYPRMTQAYLGAKTPLADLEAQSPAIAGMATALRGLIAAFDLGTLIQETAQGVIDAAGAVSGNDLHRLQYNREFKNLVAAAKYKINQMLEWENLLGEYMAGLLRETVSALGKFTWSA